MNKFTKGIVGINLDERKYQVKVRAEDKNKFDRNSKNEGCWIL